MSIQEATADNAGLQDETESGVEKQQLPLTEDEEAFKGPKFYPPVYRRRYAAVCELVKKHQAKKVLFLFKGKCCMGLQSPIPFFPTAPPPGSPPPPHAHSHTQIHIYPGVANR